MKRLDFFTLRLFVSIADTGALTAAGQREHMALAAVSKRISDLKDQLGTPLLYRRPRGVELTPAGDALLHHARAVLDNIEQLQADLSDYSAGVRGHVRLYANTSAIIEFLPRDLASFTRAHPQVKIDLEERVSGEVIQAVRDGLTDLGIYAGHVSAPGLHTRAYRTDRLVLVTAHEHPLAGSGPIVLADAMAYDFIGLQQDASLHALIFEAARSAGRRLRMRIQVRSFEGICRMIACNMGVGVLPREAVTTHIDSLGLQTVDLADPWASRQLRLAMRDYNSLPRLARQMVDHLASETDTVQTDADASHFIDREGSLAD